MKPLRFGAHGAGRLDGDHFRPTRGKPSRIATGPRADIQTSAGAFGSRSTSQPWTVSAATDS